MADQTMFLEVELAGPEMRTAGMTISVSDCTLSRRLLKPAPLSFPQGRIGGHTDIRLKGWPEKLLNYGRPTADQIIPFGQARAFHQGPQLETVAFRLLAPPYVRTLPRHRH